jgi:hypothetical protein
MMTIRSPDEANADGAVAGRNPGFDTELFSRTPALRASIRATFLVLVQLCVVLSCTAPVKQTGTLEHIVIVWLKEPGNETARQSIIDASEVLTTIPGVLSLNKGTVVSSERAIVDSSFDIALIVSFGDRAAMDAYLVHPTHVKLVEETLKPLVKRIQVYDFM